MRKIVQIAWRGGDPDKLECGRDELYALCDDGSLWLLHFNPKLLMTKEPAHTWVECKAWPPIPQEDAK